MRGWKKTYTSTSKDLRIHYPRTETEITAVQEKLRPCPDGKPISRIKGMEEFGLLMK